MSDRGKAVLDSKRVQHVAADADRTFCGEEWVALDLHWDTTTRVHCIACLAAAAGGER